MLTALEELDLGEMNVRGNEVYVRCPWHPHLLGRPDRSPGSFSINLDTGASWCFACRGGGRFADLIALVLDLRYEDALKWVLQRGAALRDPEKEKPTRPKIEVREAALALFEEPPKRELDARRIDREAAEHYGILWEPERGRWVLPIRMPDGELIGWQEKSGSTVRNRPKSMEKSKTLFGAHVFEDSPTAVLVESPLDCARLRSAEVEGGVASFGAAVSQEQIRILASLTEYVICALDDDEAGWNAALGTKDKKGRIVHGLRDSALGARMRFANYDKADGAKDVGDMTDEQVRYAIDHARGSFHFPALK